MSDPQTVTLRDGTRYVFEVPESSRLTDDSLERIGRQLEDAREAGKDLILPPGWKAKPLTAYSWTRRLGSDFEETLTFATLAEMAAFREKEMALAPAICCEVTISEKDLEGMVAAAAEASPLVALGAELIHFARAPLTPACGADGATRRTTAVRGNVTCPACRQALGRLAAEVRK